MHSCLQRMSNPGLRGRSQAALVLRCFLIPGPQAGTCHRSQDTHQVRFPLFLAAFHTSIGPKPHYFFAMTAYYRCACIRTFLINPWSGPLSLQCQPENGSSSPVSSAITPLGSCDSCKTALARVGPPLFTPDGNGACLGYSGWSMYRRVVVLK